MIYIRKYWIVNGEKSEPHQYKKTVTDRDELEAVRKKLEDEQCYTSMITGRKKTSDIIFIYCEKH